MKFLEIYRIDILNLLASHNLTPNDFSFKKKKGRILVLLFKKNKWFSFYKREDFFIDPETSKRVDISYFEIKTSNSKLIKLNQWSDVTKEFSKWINNG